MENIHNLPPRGSSVCSGNSKHTAQCKDWRRRKCYMSAHYFIHNEAKIHLYFQYPNFNPKKILLFY